MLITVEEARRLYPAGDSAHGFDHVLRVWELVRRIGPREGADMTVLEAAALLHDIARAEEDAGGPCHAQAGALRARQILAGQPTAQVEAVAEAIRTHRYRDDIPPQTLEGRILYDADKLDAIGAVGVARAFAMAGKSDRPLWSEVPPSYAERGREGSRSDAMDNEHTAIHEFIFKLSRIRDTLFTNTAKEIAAERHAFMAAFFQRLEREVKGEL